MPNTRLAVLLAACLLLGFVPPFSNRQIAAQMQTGPAVDTVRIRTELVQIDVAVKDQQGKLIRDLRREDFEIFEDGKPQQVTYFGVGTNTRPATYLNPAQRNNDKPHKHEAIPTHTTSGRHIVLAIDDYHLVPENLAAAKRALAQFVEQELAPEDQVAMTATSGALSLYQQFTTDRAVITRAINRLSLQDRSGLQLGGLPNLTEYQAELIESGDPGALQIAVEELQVRKGKPIRGNNSERGLSNPRDSDEGLVRAKARDIVTQNDRYTAITLTSLENAIRGLRQLPGRKILVLVSDGFFIGEGRKFTAYDLRNITDAATRAGVVIYSIDARGLVAKPTLGSAADPQNATITRAPDARRRVVQGEINAKLEGLYALAKDTGGLPFFNNNDLRAGLKRVLEDTEHYYVLAYEPTNQTRDGRFRKIEVRVASRPGATIQTRTGYLAPLDPVSAPLAKQKEKPAKQSAQAAWEVKLTQYRAALTSLIPLRGIPFELGTHFVHTPGTGSLAFLTAQIDASELNLELAGTVLEVVGVILDEHGKTVNNFSHNFALKSGAQRLALTPQRQLNYYHLVPLEAGTYNVRLAVADSEMKQLGSASAWLEIPDVKNKSLSLSSLFLTAEGKDLADIYEAFSAILQPKKAGETATRTLQPVHRFKRGVNLDFLLFAYNVQVSAHGTGSIAIQIKLRAGGQTIYTSPPGELPVTAEQAKLGYPCVARVPLFTYEPGAYILQIEVTDQATQQSVTRSVAFTIE